MDDLRSWVTPGIWLGRGRIVHEETRSTNDDARALASGDAPSGTMVLADRQTAGRGRSGRAWISPPGDNLSFSVIYRPTVPQHLLAPLPLVVGLAVAEALDTLEGLPRTTVKWPNDIRIEGKKVGGVLVEASLRGDSVAWVVIGVGLNVRGLRPPEGLEEIATTLRLGRGRDVSRPAVLDAIVARLEPALDAFGEFGFAPSRDALRARCDTLGKVVEVSGVRGVAEDIGVDGALVLRNADGGVERVYSGEVTG